jgi:hypothetical protein
VVGEVLSTYRDNAGALLGSAAVVFLVIGLISGLLQVPGSPALALLAAIVRFAGYALFTGFVVRLVQDVRDGRRDQTVGDLFSAAAPAILPLIVFGLLFGIGVSIGLVLLIVPGLILLTFWSVGAPAIVVEECGPIEAFGRSWRLVRGDGWAVFGTLLLVFLIVLAVQLVLTVIGAAIGDAGLVIAAIVSAAVTAPVFALAAGILYFELGGGRTAAEAPPAAL